MRCPYCDGRMFQLRDTIVMCEDCGVMLDTDYDE